MTLELTTAFFGWCSLIHFVLMMITALLLLAAPDWTYRVQNKWFPIDRHTFNIVIYSFLGLWKLFFFAFALIPYIALRLII